jgi:hypothetical protein
MTDEEFRKLVIEQLADLGKGQRELRQSFVKLENDQGTKLAALFDAYTLRGEQIKDLQKHLDERLDNIQTDLNYLVAKSAQHGREIGKLKKNYKVQEL